MGVTDLVLELQAHKAEIKGFLRSYSIAIVIFYVEKIITSCRPIIGYLFGIIFKNTKVVVVVSINALVLKNKETVLSHLKLQSVP